jgi:hypothetical protein
MHRRVLLAASASATAGAASPSAAASRGPVLVELFTSQGCSSCPPADALLGTLADRPDVVALAFHVTYWDRLGWPDRFGDPRFTDRQRAYARRMGALRVYTPQAVVQGTLDLVGSDPRLPELVGRLAARGDTAPIGIAADGTASLPPVPLAAPARLWAAAYDRRHRVAVQRGENAGRTLEHHNVVRDLIDLGAWDGTARVLALPAAPARAAGRAGVALVAQDDATGKVLALGRVALTAA